MQNLETKYANILKKNDKKEVKSRFNFIEVNQYDQGKYNEYLETKK